MLRAIEAGPVKAYNLAPGIGDPFSGELQSMPSLDAPEQYFRTYFYPTGKGLAWHKAGRTWWPLDDDDVLRSDWEPSLLR